MKKNVLNTILIVVLIIAIAGVALVVYSRFFYESDEKDPVVSEPVLSNIEKMLPIINGNTLTSSYFEGGVIAASYTDNVLNINLITGDNSVDYQIPCQSNILTLTVSDTLTFEDAKKLTNILVDSLGQVNNYQNGEFIETVDKLLEGRTINGLTYNPVSTESEVTESSITIDTSVVIIPYENAEKKEFIDGKEVVKGDKIDITKSNYVIDLGSYVAYDLKIEHNTTYNIAKLSMSIKDFNDNPSDFTLVSKLYGSDGSTLINESTYKYVHTETKDIKISTNHVFKSATDFESVKYINIEINK